MSRLNLLPPEIRNEIEVSKNSARLRQYVYYSVMISLAIATLFSVVIFILWTKKDEAVRQINLANSQISAQEEGFNNANDLASRIDLIKKIKKDNINWKTVLDELGYRTPGKVQLDSLSYLKAENRIKLSGLANTDTDAASFKESLAKSEYFDFVDIESLSEAKDEFDRNSRSFVISLTLKVDKLKR